MRPRQQPAVPPGAAAVEPEVRRTLGCLGRGGCGCLAFLVGAGVAALAVLPSLAGRWAGRWVEEAFAAEHAGRVEIPRLRFSWTRRQLVEDARLFDPEGATVARLSVEVPSLLEALELVAALDEGRTASFGEVRVELDADLVLGEDGRTNLGRALAPRDAPTSGRRGGPRVDVRGGADETGSSSGTSDWPPIEARCRVVSRRLRWSTPATRGAGRDLILHDLSGEVRLSPDGRVRGELAGVVEGSTPGRLALEGALERLPNDETGPPTRLHLQGTLEDLDADLADALMEGEGLVADTLGERADVEFTLDLDEREELRFRAGLESPRVHLDLAGEIEDGIVRCRHEDGLTLVSDLPPLLSRRVVGPLVPLLVDLSKPPGAEPLRLEAREVTWDPSRGPDGLSARVRLEPGRVLARLLPGLAEALPGLVGGPALEEALLPLELEIADGVARYRDVPLRIGGTPLLVSGTVALGSREMELSLRVPASALGRDLARLLGEEADSLRVPVELVGRVDAPRVRVEREGLEELLRRRGRSELEGRAKDLLRGILGGDGR